MEVLNSYEGPGYVEGVANPRKKSSARSIRETHGELMEALRRNGDVALNVADYERTMHLPVGKGRLACDDTGEFDKRAPRPPYNPLTAPKWPVQVHSTITDGEYRDARNKEELDEFLATRLWALKPLERKKRFTLTAEDQMMNFKGQLEGERAARLALEKQLEAGAGTSAEVLAQELQLLKLEREQEKAERKALEDRLNQLLTLMSPPAEIAKVEDEEEEVSKPVTGRRR